MEQYHTLADPFSTNCFSFTCLKKRVNVLASCLNESLVVVDRSKAHFSGAKCWWK